MQKENKRYNDYSSYSKSIFSERVQKISVDAGFTCPNRDGSKGFGGCTYCNNNTFKPFYTSPRKTVTAQLEEGIAFFGPKYQAQLYLAYFQAYSNTYASLDSLKELYEEALSHPKVIGLVIGTRPDAVTEEVLDYIAELSKKYHVFLEFGVESTSDETLEYINRGHGYAETIWAVDAAVKRGIFVGIHMILGLPGETKEMLMEHAVKISKLPIRTLKLHQLQIIKQTKMAKQFAENPEKFDLFSLDTYIETVIDFIERLKPEIIIERFSSESPKDLIIAPNWGGIKNFEIVHKIEKRLAERDTFQGKFYQKTQ